MNARNFIGFMLAGAAICIVADAQVMSHVASGGDTAGPRSAEYAAVQMRLARGWNTWDVHSVATQVLLPEGLAIHVGMKHNSTLNGDAWLSDALIGRLDSGAEEVTPGPHAWDGSYTSADYEWKGHKWRVESAHDGNDLVMLVTPLESKTALPPTAVFSVGYLWQKGGSVDRVLDDRWAADHPRDNYIPSRIDAKNRDRSFSIYCSCDHSDVGIANSPVAGPYFAAELNGPVGISTGKRRTVREIVEAIQGEFLLYVASNSSQAHLDPVKDAIETTLGWDTIYDPEKQRVISPVSRVWSVGWGGYVLFDWDTFFAATLAGVGDKDLAYANALEILREETAEGFVPNYARAGGWKSSDRSEPPVGAITVLGLYEKFHDRWFLRDAFEPLLKWNRWWAEHRDVQGYLAWGSDGANEPQSVDDGSRGTWQGAIYESGLDNSPMYDGTFYNPQTHVVEFADVGLMGMYVADCDALAKIAEALGKAAEAKELRERGERYRAKLKTMWDEKTGMFLNVNLHTGEKSTRLSPTNFYPLLARAATPEQAARMVKEHLMNPEEFWGQYVIPSIARDDPAFKDQQYWRGRIWGPMNYLVYLGLRNYDLPEVRKEFAQKSYDLFLKEWKENRHVHENYNAITGSGDDVTSSDRFYHWGALLGYVEWMERQ